MISNVEVVRRIAASESTAQCETSNARARPERASAPGLSPAMVLPEAHHLVHVEFELRQFARRLNARCGWAGKRLASR